MDFAWFKPREQKILVIQASPNLVDEWNEQPNKLEAAYYKPFGVTAHLHWQRLAKGYFYQLSEHRAIRFPDQQNHPPK